MYAPLNQYRVVMEVEPGSTRAPTSLENIYVRIPTGALVPLTAIAQLRAGDRPSPSTTRASSRR